MQPAAGAIGEDGEAVQCTVFGSSVGYRAAAGWFKGFWRSFHVEQHGSRLKFLYVKVFKEEAVPL